MRLKLYVMMARRSVFAAAGACAQARDAPNARAEPIRNSRRCIGKLRGCASYNVTSTFPMSQATTPTDRAGGLTCPDCDEPLVFTFRDTSGVGAHKRGDNFNTIPDTDHFICFSCASAWKQRLSGNLTPDIVGDLAFFVC